MDEARITFWQRLTCCILCGGVFGVVYHWAMEYAQKLPFVPSYVFDFEKYIPFWEWLVIPYMTSGVFFVLVFFWCRNHRELSTLTKRMLFTTLVAGIIFVVFPLKFSFEKPVIQSAVLQPFFRFLEQYDSLYNQAPSLHIVYAVIFAGVVVRRFGGVMCGVLLLWIFLMGSATLLIYQHHFIDIIAGLCLVGVSFRVFR